MPTASPHLTEKNSASKDRAEKQALIALRQIRQTEDWECLRRHIYKRALRLANNAVFDFRQLFSDSRMLEQAGRLLWQIVKPFSPQVLVGPGFGAAPLLASIALTALADGQPLTTLMVRDKRKEHNQKKWVEGW